MTSGVQLIIKRKDVSIRPILSSKTTRYAVQFKKCLFNGRTYIGRKNKFAQSEKCCVQTVGKSDANQIPSQILRADYPHC